MGTTASGLRYPEPTDPLPNGAAAMKNLADDVTSIYTPEPTTGGVTGGGALSPDAQTVPAGAALRVVAGKLNVTTDAAGQFVLTITAFTTAIVGMTISSAVSLSAPFDNTFSIAARGPNSVYGYVMRAGVKLASTTVGITYIAVGY
jgi:hypothetical protein